MNILNVNINYNIKIKNCDNGINGIEVLLSYCIYST